VNSHKKISKELVHPTPVMHLNAVSFDDFIDRGPRPGAREIGLDLVPAFLDATLRT
jgi:hypothetical protein